MAKLYFKFGAMGSSKSAQALITKFNYEELGMSVWLIKPSIDTRDGADIVRSRIGLEARAQIITPEQDITEEYHKAGKHDVIIADEAQFLTPAQIEQLRLRTQGDGQRKARRAGQSRDDGRPGPPRRQRQLHRHVPQMLEAENKRTEISFIPRTVSGG